MLRFFATELWSKEHDGEIYNILLRTNAGMRNEGCNQTVFFESTMFKKLCLREVQAQTRDRQLKTRQNLIESSMATYPDMLWIMDKTVDA